jgi:vitamin B12/bleomycin/antimicrobial peptide transport system ATP-binding/permease protein
VLIQTAHAFERVNEALSWFIGSYTVFAQWRAAAERLTGFATEINRQAEAAVFWHAHGNGTARHDRLV